MEIFRVRLNCVDHYQASPTEFDPYLLREDASNNGQKLPRVPVIRVFGATETGQKVCVHVHGMFPYLYLDYAGSLDADKLELYKHRLRLSIDHALAISYRRNLAGENATFVAHITLVKGIPFYGYHVGYRPYIKVYLLNPMNITRLADLLRQGAIMKRPMQPYESHMQYVPQWMSDYNLYGCAYLEFSKYKFRSPVPSFDEMASDAHKWHDRSIPWHAVSDQSILTRQSHCPLELDVCVPDIVNRHDISHRPLHHDFVEYFEPRTETEKLVHSMAGLWKDETRRRKARMGLVDADSSPFPAEVLVTVSADPRDTKSGGWIHEEEFREKMNAIIQKEAEELAPNIPAFNTFAFSDNLALSELKTAFQSIDDLYPENLPVRDSKHQIILPQHSVAVDGVDDFADIDVDESRILDEQALDGGDFPLDIEDFISEETGLPNSDSAKDFPGESKLNAENGVDPHATETAEILRRSYKSEEQTEFNNSLNQSLQTSSGGSNRFGEQQGDFEIPDDCTSNISAAVARHERHEKRKIEAEHSNPPRKRTRFVIQHERQVPRTDPISSAESIPAVAVGRVLDNGQIFDNVSIKDQAPKAGQIPQFSTPATQTTPVKSSTRESPWSKSPNSGNGVNQARTEFDLTKAIKREFCPDSSDNLLVYNLKPPARQDLSLDPQRSLFMSRIYTEAHYGHDHDVPERSREYGGNEFKIEGSSIRYLPDFDSTGLSAASRAIKIPKLVDKDSEARRYTSLRTATTLSTWEYLKVPPSFQDVLDWTKRQSLKSIPKTSSIETDSQGRDLSQIEGPTQANKHGFKFAQKKKSTSVKFETQYMSVMSLEVHVNTRGTFVPNPELDEVSCVFWAIQSDETYLLADGSERGPQIGMIVLAKEPGLSRKLQLATGILVEEELTELDVMMKLIDIVRLYDPDILTGFEVHGGSWGYLIERARTKFDYNLCDELSRTKSSSHGRYGKEADRWGFNTTSTIRITGRHMINIWRAMRGELNLLQYTMENIVFHLLHKRIPHFSFADLTKWYQSEIPRDVSKAVNYFLGRVQLDLEILEANELVARTSEQARLLGVDFFSVFSRGSQFKVESLMFRIAKPENFILISPSRKQVGQQNALECLPLVMEPQSNFYSSPMLVLDFQSLYPSIMIAYNYCYSTFLGRIVGWQGQNKMGFTDLQRQAQVLKLLEEHVNIAPNGMMYVRPEVRKSLLAKMLGEILETRVMVKSGMKVDKDDKTLQQLLNNRQLALKLIANVTYGYTTASFSGRMPCSEIADSIVQSGRETLERTIALIHSVKKWDAEVVYGDTDSLFIYLKGRTREEAFNIGEDIARTVTSINPRPIKLKFEKVYHPCVLLAKKRYVGFKYEHRNQAEPEFEAKGIETVRRDGTPAEQKIEERALKILFRSADLSEVKSYVQDQLMKIMRGKVSIQDFCFAKEVKLGTYSDRGPPPPGALISTRRMLEDPRAEPQYGERVPYVVVTGSPGARLIDRCVDPTELLYSDHHELDADYYISKNIIPPLERIFNLIGANVRQWYDEMPKSQRIRRNVAPVIPDPGAGLSAVGIARKTLESYMKASSCHVCHEKLEEGAILCPRCASQPDVSTLTLQARISKAESRALEIARVCRSCSATPFGDEVRCDSRDCPVFYTRLRYLAKLKSEKAMTIPLMKVLEDMTDW